MCTYELILNGKTLNEADTNRADDNVAPADDVDNSVGESKTVNAIEDATGRMHSEKDGRFIGKAGKISENEGLFSVIVKEGDGMFPIPKVKTFTTRHEAELCRDAVLAKKTLKKDIPLVIQDTGKESWVAYEGREDVPVPSTRAYKKRTDAEKVKFYLEESLKIYYNKG